jgi:ferric-dicitrate binding protein FerR (iron transport regulator)
MGKVKPPVSLLELCFIRAGGSTRSIAKTARVCEFIMAWVFVANELEREPSTSEFARWWKMTEKEERTAWRRLAEYRELFPEYSTPEPFSAQLAEASEEMRLTALAKVAV